MSSSRYTIHREHHHFGWDNANRPVLTVAPGDTVEFEVVEASGGQLSQDSTVADVGALDFTKVNPVTGPVYVDGIEPGDALKVRIESFAPVGWGWTALIPGFGLLADQFPDPAIHLWRYDAARLGPAAYGPGGRVPLKPFAGTIGVAPAEPGLHSIVPPRRVGGNMDIRDLAAGSELLLPVEVAGALFSVGDTHVCALFDDQTALCWGANYYGQLGAATSENIGDDELPTAYDPLLLPPIRQIDAGGNHTCAILDETNELYCWGTNTNGELGYGHTMTIGDDEALVSAGPVQVL